MPAGDKHPDALKTIGELSRELGIAQHILRYWETRFPQLKPMQRAGNRRYYRPADVELVRRIDRLLNHEGYTVRGVQKLLRERSAAPVHEAPPAPPPGFQPHTDIPGHFDSLEHSEPLPAAEPAPTIDVFRLIAIRNRLASLVTP